MWNMMQGKRQSKTTNAEEEFVSILDFLISGLWLYKTIGLNLKVSGRHL